LSNLYLITNGIASMRFVIPGSQVSDKHLLNGYDGNWKVTLRLFLLVLVMKSCLLILFSPEFHIETACNFNKNYTIHPLAYRTHSHNLGRYIVKTNS